MTHETAAVPDTVRAMMAGAIDYAGLFPPASLMMPQAVCNYDAYRRGPHAWMLGRFIVPVARLEEFASAFSALPGARHAEVWRVSVIATAGDAPALAAFNTRYGSRVRIDTIEAPVVRLADVAALGDLAHTYTVFAEVNVAMDVAPIVTALATRGIGAKVRTGGVTADAIPTPEQVARFMVVCRAARVSFKATAGLHHAFRAQYALTYERESARAELFGFVNVLLASAAAASGADAAEVAAILRAPGGFALDARAAVLPSGRELAPDAIARARGTAIASFGSCSFDEPVSELSAAGLL